MEKFTRYLNKSFFKGADPLLRTKYQRFLETTATEEQSDTVFERLEKDQRHR